MTHGEMFYLWLVIATFAAFMISLSATSWYEQHRRK